MTVPCLRTGILAVSICLTLTADRVQQDRRQVSNGEPTNLTLTPEQAEVWKGEQDLFRYLQSRNLKKFMTLWDERFVGWPDYHEHPVRKMDIERDVAEEFRSSQPTAEYNVMPKPESVVVFGNVAVTYYFWPETGGSSTLGYRVTHTWLKGADGWHIIGGMGCAIPRPSPSPK